MSDKRIGVAVSAAGVMANIARVAEAGGRVIDNPMLISAYRC